MPRGQENLDALMPKPSERRRAPARQTRTPRISQKEKEKTIQRVLSARTFRDACRPLMELLHDHAIQTRETGTGRKGSTAVARFTRLRPFDSQFKLRDWNKLKMPALAYVDEIGPKKDITHMLPEVPLPRSGKRSPFRIARVFLGQQGNRDKKGRPTHLHDPRFNQSTEPRSTFIDKRFGQAPSDHVVLLMGPESQPVGVLDAYCTHPVDAGTLRDVQSVLEHPAVREKLFNAWHAEEAERQHLGTHIKRVEETERRDPYAVGHSTRVARIALAMAAAINEKLVARDKEPLLAPGDLEYVAWAALGHDMGKSLQAVSPETDLYDESHPEVQGFRQRARIALGHPAPHPGSLRAIVLAAATHTPSEKREATKEQRIAELVAAASAYDSVMAPRADTREVTVLRRGNNESQEVRGKRFSHETAVDHMRHLARKGIVRHEHVSALEKLSPKSVRAIYADYKPRDWLLEWEGVNHKSTTPPFHQPSARLRIPITRDEE